MPERPTEEEQRRLYETLGRLVVRFSWLEDNLHDAVAVALFPTDMKFGNVLTAGMPFRTLVEKVGALIHVHPGRRASDQEIEDLCAELNTVNDQRNVAMHSVYGTNRDGEATTVKRTAIPKSGFSLNPREVSLTDLDALIDRIDRLERRVWELVP